MSNHCAHCTLLEALLEAYGWLPCDDYLVHIERLDRRLPYPSDFDESMRNFSKVYGLEGEERLIACELLGNYYMHTVHNVATGEAMSPPGTWRLWREAGIVYGVSGYVICSLKPFAR